MTSKEAYERHLAEAAPGTPLHTLMRKVGSVDVTAEELIAYARWEMWEAIYSLPPESGARGEMNNSGEVSRVTDGFHASCCVVRAAMALRLLEKTLAR